MKQNLFNPFDTLKGKIHIISPARAPSKNKVLRALKFFDKLRIDYSISEKIFDASKSPIPSLPQSRADEFNSAISDENVVMILCSRGGFGCSDILPLINWELLKKRNIIVMGFSDISALHLAMLKMKAGLPIAGPMLADLPQSFVNDFAGISLKKALSNDKTEFKLSDFCEIRSYKKGFARGKICVSNLTLLSSMLGTKYMPSLKNKILLIEDLNEAHHKIYRYLAHLELSGAANSLAAILLGDFKNCGKKAELDSVFANFAKRFNIPFLSGIPFGHIKKIFSLRLNSEVLIEGDKVSIF